MGWLEGMGNPALAVVVLGAFVGAALLGLWLTRSWVQRFNLTHNELARFVFEGVTVVYAVLLGLIAVGAWENYTATEQATAHEAATLVELAWDLEGYPEAFRGRMAPQLAAYADLVISDDWPKLARRQEPQASDAAMRLLVGNWSRFAPTTEAERLLQAEVLRRLNELVGHRRERILTGNAGLPGELWFVVLAGAMLTVGFTFFFWTDNRRVHALMVASLAGMIGLVVFLILAFEHPLWGRSGLRPEAFERARALLTETAPGGPQGGR